MSMGGDVNISMRRSSASESVNIEMAVQAQEPVLGRVSVEALPQPSENPQVARVRIQPENPSENESVEVEMQREVAGGHQAEEISGNIQETSGSTGIRKEITELWNKASVKGKIGIVLAGVAVVGAVVGLAILGGPAWGPALALAGLAVSSAILSGVASKLGKPMLSEALMQFAKITGVAAFGAAGAVGGLVTALVVMPVAALMIYGTAIADHFVKPLPELSERKGPPTDPKATAKHKLEQQHDYDAPRIKEEDWNKAAEAKPHQAPAQGISPKLASPAAENPDEAQARHRRELEEKRRREMEQLG